MTNVSSGMFESDEDVSFIHMQNDGFYSEGTFSFVANDGDHDSCKSPGFAPIYLPIILH